MMEKLKTIALVLLVGLSLIQSFILTGNAPEFDSIDQTEYVQAEWLGPQREISDLLFPAQMVVHLGDETQKKIYPETKFFDMIYNEFIKKRWFGEFTLLSNDSKEYWDQLQSSTKGIELQFKEAIPLNLLQRIIPKGELVGLIDPIHRIWIMTMDEEKEEAKTLFINDSEMRNGRTIVYEATKAHFTLKDIEKFIGFGEFLPVSYSKYDLSFYVAEQSVPMIRYTYDYDELIPDNIQRNLFVDPMSTRNLRERSGTEIYTDGKRMLQIKHEPLWISFTDTPLSNDSQMDLVQNMQAALRFINQHGGWNGTFGVERMPNQVGVGDQVYYFQQYIGAYGPGSFPVIWEQTETFGYMKVILQRGIVSNFERTLITLKKDTVVREQTEIMGGERLRNRLQQFEDLDKVIDLYPGYLPFIEEGKITFEPVWIIKWMNGQTTWIEN